MYMVLLLHAVAIAENFDSDDLISTPPPPHKYGCGYQLSICGIWGCQLYYPPIRVPPFGSII